MTLGNSPRKSCGNKILITTLPLLVASLAVATLSLNKLTETTHQLTEASTRLSEATVLLQTMQQRVELMANTNEALATEFAELKVSLAKDQHAQGERGQYRDGDLMSRFRQQLEIANAKAMSGGLSSSAMDADVLDSMKAKIMDSIPQAAQTIAASVERTAGEMEAAIAEPSSSQTPNAPQPESPESPPQVEEAKSATGAADSAPEGNGQASGTSTAAGDKG